MLEIPEDLHNIFEERLNALINDYPEMVSAEYDEDAILKLRGNIFRFNAVR
jgi:hypothetical protein